MHNGIILSIININIIILIFTIIFYYICSVLINNFYIKSLVHNMSHCLATSYLRRESRDAMRHAGTAWRLRRFMNTKSRPQRVLQPGWQWLHCVRLSAWEFYHVSDVRARRRRAAWACACRVDVGIIILL